MIRSAIALFLVLSAAIAAPAPGFLLKREGWSFDRSHLNWFANAKPDELKASGELKNVSGWAEYDFEIPEDGWHELWLRGFPSGWTRTVSLDGQTVLWHSVSSPEDEDKSFKGFKEANLWLKQGRHTLRFLRVTWPGDLPDYWELRAANGNPAGSVRVTAGENVVRAGEAVSLTLTGGSDVPLKYELVVRNTETGEITPAGEVEFPAVAKPVERKVAVTFPAEGVFSLQARAGDQLLRPADLKAGTFVVVDTKPAPLPPAEIQTKTVVDIDCSAEPPREGFWEKDGKTRIVKKPFGSYRESSGLGGDGDGYWGLDGFSYRIKLPEVDRLYRIRVAYPDDDRRSMGFWINDGSDPKSTFAAYANTGGVETGDQYSLTKKMQVHEAYFYPQAKDEVIVAVLNLVPNLKAAASRITIDLVESGLPAAPLGETRGRDMGFYFEENGRWLKFFGAAKGGGIREDLKTLNRWGQWNRYLGADLMFPTINVYQGNHYPSHILEGYFSRAINEVRLGALVAEKYGNRFVPEFHMSGQDWFDREVMGVWVEERKENGKDTTEIKFASPQAEEGIVRDRDGNYKYAAEPFLYNALHPRVQEKYIAVLGELADTLADCKSFAGISSRMMFGWQWQGWNALPNMNWGYDDWTIAYFEKDTGIKVPGKPGDPGRFRERYNFLTGPENKRWVDWRCAKIFDYHQRLLARIQKAKPTARLFFNWFGLDPRHALSTDMLEQMREVGMDWRRYAKEANIVVIPAGGTYGRRFSIPISDAAKLDSAYDPSILAAGRFAGRAYGLYSDYFEVNRNLDWSKLGGKPYSAFDANLPSGLNERAMYAQAMADCDTGFFSNGGSGWIFGTPEVMQPFLREYRALPSVPFEPWDKARDPVAVWSHRDKAGTLWFYAVNRLPVSVNISIGLKAKEVIPAPGGEKIPLAGGRLPLTLEPFMMKSFRADGGAKLTNFQAEVPQEYVNGLKPMLAFAKALRDALADRKIAPELTRSDTDAALACFDGALAAFDRKEYFKARGLLERLAAVQVYYLTGKYPPGLWQRSQDHGTVPLADRPPQAVCELTGAFGKLGAIADLTYDAAGNLWLSSGTQLMEVGAAGQAVKVLTLFAPFDSAVSDIRNATLPPPLPLAATAVQATRDGNLLLQQNTSPPLSYETARGRMLPFANKGFLVPGLPVWLLAMTINDEPVISCGAAGKAGVYLYNADGTPKRKLSDNEARAAAVDRAGQIYLAGPEKIEALSPEGKVLEQIPGAGFVRLAVTPDGRTLLALHGQSNRIYCFQRNGNGALAASWNQSLPAPVSAMAFAPDGSLAVGFKSADQNVMVRAYSLGTEGLVPSRDLVKALTETESLDGDTPLKVFEGRLYFSSQGKLMRLTPGNPDTVEVAFDPKFRNDQVAFESFAFAPNRDLYLSSNWNGIKRGINVFLCRWNGHGWNQPEALNQGAPLWEGGYFKARDLAVDDKGRLILRLPNPDAKGRNLSLYRWSPQGGRELLINLGEDSADGEYGLDMRPDGSLLVAGGGSRKILRIAPDGKLAWMTERLKSSPPGYDDLRFPLGITEDSQGGIWVADPSRHEILRLDASGKLLGAIGSFGSGQNAGDLLLNRPSGIAALKDTSGKEWIYVADGGNRRLVKWPVNH